jgi:hypothetical protein
MDRSRVVAVLSELLAANQEIDTVVDEATITHGGVTHRLRVSLNCRVCVARADAQALLDELVAALE